MQRTPRMAVGHFSRCWPGKARQTPPIRPRWLPGSNCSRLSPRSSASRRRLEHVGTPLDPERQTAVDKALSGTDADAAARQIQAVLDPLCLAIVNINPESRVKVAPGPAPPRIVAAGLARVSGQGA